MSDAAGHDGHSYYGRPIIKPPVWQVPDVPAYLFLGGLAGASATMASVAEATGRPGLCRVARITAAAGSSASVVALIHDLGRPRRFLNMLRVFKPTSPLSVGSWILAPFSGLSGAVAASEITGLLPWTARWGGALAGALGPAMTTYTAVLLSDTAVPGWHEVRDELPFVFAGSAVASAGGVATATAPAGEAAPARRMVVIGAVLELAASRRMERRAGLAGEPYRTGSQARVLRAARWLTGVGAVAAAIPARGRAGRVVFRVAGACVTAAGAATRYGIFEAGRVTARDPRYTVEPQRARREERESSPR